MNSSSNGGPIEYVGKADRKADRKPGATGTTPTPAGGRKSRFGWLWGLGAIALFVAYIASGSYVRAAVLHLACDISACSAAGMTTAGWLVIAAPAGVLAATSLLWAKLAKPGRRALGAAAVLVCVVALSFIPGRGQGPSDLLKGPGSDALTDGLMWALGAAGAVLVFMMALALAAGKAPAVERRFAAIALAVSTALMAGALPLAIAESDPTWVRAAELFPPVLTMNGDTLVRTSASDQRGCDGVLPDDALLNRHDCYLTVRVTFTTDDSDAVATLQAVLYSDNETADAVRDGVPSGLTPVGASAGAAAVVSVTHSWVLVGAAAHADGRPITAQERSWVLWPLRQVSYHFIGAQAGIFIDPDPSDAVSPRTP